MPNCTMAIGHTKIYGAKGVLCVRVLSALHQPVTVSEPAPADWKPSDAYVQLYSLIMELIEYPTSLLQRTKGTMVPP